MEFNKYEMIIMLFIMLFLGWASNEIYREIKQDRIINGLHFRSDKNHEEAISYSKTYDSKGNWVCVNVRGMDFDKAVETCQHESAHEIFAGIIEDHPEKIQEVMEVIENE